MHWSDWTISANFLPDYGNTWNLWRATWPLSYRSFSFSFWWSICAPWLTWLSQTRTKSLATTLPLTTLSKAWDRLRGGPRMKSFSSFGSSLKFCSLSPWWCQTVFSSRCDSALRQIYIWHQQVTKRDTISQKWKQKKETQWSQRCVKERTFCTLHQCYLMCL